MIAALGSQLDHFGIEELMTCKPNALAISDGDAARAGDIAAARKQACACLKKMARLPRHDLLSRSMMRMNSGLITHCYRTLRRTVIVSQNIHR
jgi:hypothetical protein